MAKISSIEAFEANVPLPEPIAVGSTVLKARTYTIVRVRCEDGLEGIGYCYSRGLPIKEIVLNMIAPVVIGKVVENSEDIRAEVLATYWHSAEHGTFTAAVSAVDIAIWDALGKMQNKSVAQILGQKHHSLPVSYVVGYKYGSDESGLIADVENAISRGVKNFKLVVGAGTPERDVNRMKVIRDRIGEAGRIGADAFRSFKSVDDATKRVNALKEFDLAFIEDPFLESQGDLVLELRAQTGVMVAVGESQFGHRGIANMVRHRYVDLVRVDALVVGGVKEFLLSAEIARNSGLRISTHIHSEVHAQLAATIDNLDIGGLEYMDPKLN
ncbi:MAG: mandelate racemase/muconate lactonizing enzyme family protein, partial [Actinobacteria bacterium]|nr:mandelate racemase/muconate lactonizing enzyme family protein [Actinomycetota bacterium]